VVGLAIVALVLLTWGWVVREAAAMARLTGHARMAGMTMPDLTPWSPGRLPWLAAMWAVMMAAMMLPGAAPLLLLYASFRRRRQATASPIPPTAVFLLGYLAVWGAFSAGAALVQWWLHRVAVLSPGMQLASPRLAGILLMVAGIYQWLPVKHACLAHCMSPLGFVTAHWREGTLGAFRMGLAHGGYCLGCCWLLMVLLFAGGVMNLAWVAGLTLLTLGERVLPWGARIARMAGIVLVGWGGWLTVGVR
jgi:predicted metal-binding membrane protein